MFTKTGEHVPRERAFRVNSQVSFAEVASSHSFTLKEFFAQSGSNPRRCAYRPPKRLANGDAAAAVSPSGFLLFLRQTTLFAQAFNFKRQELSGNPFPAAEQVAFNPGGTFAPGFSATSGIVAYRSGSAGVARQLTWLDRSGKDACHPPGNSRLKSSARRPARQPPAD